MRTTNNPRESEAAAPARLEDHTPIPERDKRTNGLARLVLAAFVFTFILARLLVIAIMAGKLPPELFFHMHGTHVHHLNYGIFLLSISGAYLIFAQPVGRRLSACAVMYGVGLALTFDEFGMWLHLGGPYWQRASYDAVITIAAVLALLAYGSTIRRWRPRHHFTFALLLLALCIFGYVLNESVNWAGSRVGPLLEQLEDKGPT